LFVFVLGLCTIGSFYLTLNKPQNFGFYNTLITYTLICLFGVIIAYLRGCQKLLPDTIIDELSSENNYSISFCDNQSLCEADEMTRPYFGRGFIPFDKIEQWRLKNQKGFVQINNSEGTLCACFVILGLESSFLNQFIAGRLTEHDISSDVVLSFDEMKKENCIYLSGVVVREPYSYMGHKRTRVMLWAILQYIKKVFGLRKSRIFYAIGLTKESEIIKCYGF